MCNMMESHLIFNDRCWIILIATIQIIGSAEKDHMPGQQDPLIWIPWIIIAWGTWRS
jgi:hypothetical protein